MLRILHHLWHRKAQKAGRRRSERSRSEARNGVDTSRVALQALLSLHPCASSDKCCCVFVLARYRVFVLSLLTAGFVGIKTGFQQPIHGHVVVDGIPLKLPFELVSRGKVEIALFKRCLFRQVVTRLIVGWGCAFCLFWAFDGCHEVLRWFQVVLSNPRSPA